MQIKSNIRDYYDHVAHLYGGGDPSIQYIRKRLTPLRDTGCSLISDVLTVEQKGLMHLPSVEYNSRYGFKWLSVAGKRYLLVRTMIGDVYSFIYTDWKIFSEKEQPELWDRFNSKRRNWHGDRMTTSNDYVGTFSESLVELSRKVGAPVFTFNCGRGSQVLVDGDIPILSDLGMPKIISAEQLYQELSYFVGNIMKESPDMMPPTKMSDKEKILQHGFDNRISFRHRV